MRIQIKARRQRNMNQTVNGRPNRKWWSSGIAGGAGVGATALLVDKVTPIVAWLLSMLPEPPPLGVAANVSWLACSLLTVAVMQAAHYWTRPGDADGVITDRDARLVKY